VINENNVPDYIPYIDGRTLLNFIVTSAESDGDAYRNNDKKLAVSNTIKIINKEINSYLKDIVKYAESQIEWE